MTDVHTPEQRSRNMAAIRGKDTKPEIVVRTALHALGFRFRLHRKDLPGTPDIVLPKYRTVIFVHGCFWHSHNCRYGRVTPATRSEFWSDKRAGTVDRDLRKYQSLRERGWKVATIWECETKDGDELGRILRERLNYPDTPPGNDEDAATIPGKVSQGDCRAMAPHELDLNRLKQLMRAAGATQLFLKRLAENDNSKNQVYLGPDLTALNVLPNGPLAADPTKPALLKSPVHFSWLTLSGNVLRAPNAQLILYPQYPEVRFSGFLKGCSDPPSDVMTVRQGGRILFFGITASGQVLGFAAAHNSALAGEIEALGLEPDNGVFSRIPVEVRTDDRQLLLSELARISRLGWIDSKRLNSGGEILPCVATNCGGLTLEAELGVRPNSLTDPDFHGWEIKQYGVKNLARLTSGGAITLMTPEPTGGVYVADGIHEFIRRFGYPDRKIDDRRNFGGVHTAVKICAKTNLTLTLEGYNLAKHTITDFTKGISLLDQNGEAAATWHYKDLLGHWTRKHALAAYVPSINRKTMLKQYQYGTRVRLAEGTEFRLFLNAVASGAVYYDPGIKIVNVSGVHPEVKKRSQFRIKSSAIPQLYTSVTEVDVSA